MTNRPYRFRIQGASPIASLFSLFPHNQGQNRNKNFLFSGLLLFLFGFVSGCAAPLANPAEPNSSLVVGRVIINNRYPGPSGASGTLHIGKIEELIDVEIASVDRSKILEATTGEGGYFFSANIPPGLYYLNKVIIRGEDALLWEMVTMNLGKRNFFTVPAASGKIVEAGTYYLDVAERLDLKLKHEQFDPGTVKLFLMNKYPGTPWLSENFVAKPESLNVADTLGNRRAAGERFWAAIPWETVMQYIRDRFKKMGLAGIFSQMGIRGPNREIILKLKKELLRKERLIPPIRDALAQLFTATEIDAMARYFSSTVGRSIMKKIITHTLPMDYTVEERSVRARFRASPEGKSIRNKNKLRAYEREVNMIVNREAKRALKEILEEQKKETSAEREPLSVARRSIGEAAEKSGTTKDKRSPVIKKEKAAGKEMASLPGDLSGPEALHPKWSAYLKGRDFSRVASMESKFPVSVVLFHQTKGKVVGDTPFDSVSIVEVSSRLTKSIKQNLERLIQKKFVQIKMASSQRLLILVEVSKWEIEYRYGAHDNTINFSAKVKIKKIDEEGKKVSDDQFQTMEWVKYDKGLYEDRVLHDLIDEAAVEIAKKLLEIPFSVN